MSFMKGWKLSVAKATWVVLALLFITNILLLRQNLQLRARLSRLQPELAKVGDKLSPLAARGLSDETVNVRYTGEGPKRVLMYFTPT
ncbi:MAG TPA: hypothetical protein VGV59_16690 [Pyrinomonadaceae bacterium]|nr:hypothetical protein [Pyrinomonadaceae bacterium]